MSSAHAVEFGETEGWERPYGTEPATTPAPTAAPAVKRRDQGQRNAGMLLNLGVWNGLGFGAQLGSPLIGVRLSGGWSPLIVSRQLSSGAAAIKFLSDWLVSGDVFVNAVDAEARGRAGPIAGYRYSSLLGHGLAIGGWGGFRVNRGTDLIFQGGALVFPRGPSRLRRDVAGLEGVKFTYPNPGLQIGVSATLALFP